MNIEKNPGGGFLELQDTEVNIGKAAGLALFVGGAAAFGLAIYTWPKVDYIIFGVFLGLPVMLLGMLEIFRETGVTLDKGKNSVTVWRGLRMPGRTRACRLYDKKRLPLDRVMGIGLKEGNASQGFCDIDILFQGDELIRLSSPDFFSGLARAQALALFLKVRLIKGEAAFRMLPREEETRFSLYEYLKENPERAEARDGDYEREIYPGTFFFADARKFVSGLAALALPLAVTAIGVSKSFMMLLLLPAGILLVICGLLFVVSRGFAQDKVRVEIADGRLGVTAGTRLGGRTWERRFSCSLESIKDIVLLGVPLRGLADAGGGEALRPLVPDRTFHDTALLIRCGRKSLVLPLVEEARQAWEFYAELANRAVSARRGKA